MRNFQLYVRMMSDEINTILKELLISDKIKIGFYQESKEWEIINTWEFQERIFIEVKYSEHNKAYTSTQAFDKSRVDAILRDNKLNKLLNS